MADNIEPRIAVLEQIARNTEQALTEIRADIREIRAEMRSEFRDVRADMKSQFRWLLGLIVLVLLAQAALWQQMGRLEGQVGAQLGEISTLLRQQRAQ